MLQLRIASPVFATCLGAWKQLTTDVVVTAYTVALPDLVCYLQEMSFTHLSSVARTVSDMDDEIYQRLRTDRSRIA